MKNFPNSFSLQKAEEEVCEELHKIQIRIIKQDRKSSMVSQPLQYALVLIASSFFRSCTVFQTRQRKQEKRIAASAVKLAFFLNGFDL